MTKHFTLTIVKNGTKLKLTYLNERFKRFEIIKGKLLDAQIFQIGKIIPPNQQDIQHYLEYHKQITIEPFNKAQKNEPSVFSKFNSAWFAFYKDYAGFPPAFNGADGKALKQIISNLTAMAGTEDEALTLWDVLLGSWKDLADFHQSHTDLKYINSQLNVLLNAIKKSNSKTGTNGASSDLRRKTAENLSSVQPNSM